MRSTTDYPPLPHFYLLLLIYKTIKMTFQVHNSMEFSMTISASKKQEVNIGLLIEKANTERRFSSPGAEAVAVSREQKPNSSFP